MTDAVVEDLAQPFSKIVTITQLATSKLPFRYLILLSEELVSPISRKRQSWLIGFVAQNYSNDNHLPTNSSVLSPVVSLRLSFSESFPSSPNVASLSFSPQTLANSATLCPSLNSTTSFGYRLCEYRGSAPAEPSDSTIFNIGNVVVVEEEEGAEVESEASSE